MTDQPFKNYDLIMEHMIMARRDLCAEGVDSHEMLAVFADFLVLNTLALCQTKNIGIYAVHSLMHRQTGMLHDWVNGNGPFEKVNDSAVFDPEQSEN